MYYLGPWLSWIFILTRSCTVTLVTTNLMQANRCRSRQILGVRSIFAQISPNVPEKMTSKKTTAFHFILGAFFSNQSTSTAIFAQIFSKLSQISLNCPKNLQKRHLQLDFGRHFLKTKHIKPILRRFSHILPRLPKILPGFEGFSPHQNFWGCACTSVCYTTVRALSNVHAGRMFPTPVLNKIYDFKFQERFPNLCICLRILLTIPATVASAERSFRKLKLIKNYLRATSGQFRVVYLARLNIASKFAQEV